MNTPIETPHVIFGNILIEYYDSEPKQGKKQEKKSAEFIGEPITVFEDMQTIPPTIKGEYFKRYELVLKGKSSKKISITDITITDFHSYHGKVNYVHKDGWHK